MSLWPSGRGDTEHPGDGRSGSGDDGWVVVEDEAGVGGDQEGVELKDQDGDLGVGEELWVAGL